MRRFVALFRRELRDARWHLAASFVVAAVTPWAVHSWMTAGADDELVATIGGRGVVPILFALFVASAASDLVAREVATRRIDALAVLPVPISTVWNAKAVFLLASSLAMLLWIVAAEFAALAFGVSDKAAALLPSMLVAAGPSIAGGLALGAASLFFSALVDRGMTAALGAVVVLVAVGAGVEWAEVPAASGVVTTLAGWAVPLGLAAAFVLASRASFVRGPIHGPSKLRIFAHGGARLLAFGLAGGATAALVLVASSRWAFGEGRSGERSAFLSPDGKWVAIEEWSARANVVCSTWLVGIDDGSCREIAPGNSWFAATGAWLPGSMLRVHTAYFSMLDGPRVVRALDVEPSRLGVADERRFRGEPAMETDESEWNWGKSRFARRTLWRPREDSGWATVRFVRTKSPGHSLFEVVSGARSRQIECDDVVASRIRGVLYVLAADGSLTRRSFDDGTGTEIARGVTGMAGEDGSGRRLLLLRGQPFRVIDARTGAEVYSAPSRGARWVGAARDLLQSWSWDAKGGTSRSALHDLDAGTTVDLGTPVVADAVPSVDRLRDGRLVVCDGDVTLRAADGKVIRRLYPPPAAGEKGN